MKEVIYIQIEGLSASDWRDNLEIIIRFATSIDSDLRQSDLGLLSDRIPGTAAASGNKFVGINVNTDALKSNTRTIIVSTLITALVAAAGLLHDGSRHDGYECVIETNQGTRTLKVGLNEPLTPDLVSACLKGEVPKKISVTPHGNRPPQRSGGRRP